MGSPPCLSARDEGISRKVKTDKRDARALCDAYRLGAFRSAHRSSEDNEACFALVLARPAGSLSNGRTNVISGENGGIAGI